MFVDALGLTAPIAAFNGGVFVDHDMKMLEHRTIPASIIGPILDLLETTGLDAWIYRAADWLVRDATAPHVEREKATVRFAPTVVPTFADLTEGIVKIVGISDDLDRVGSTESKARAQFGDHLSAARSQPYYLDFTHPQANKGAVAQYLAATFDIPTASIATLGDMPNDVLMFAHSGLSIAMGNASLDVQRTARRVTTSNDDDGFAQAIERYVLPRRPGPGRPQGTP